LKNRKHLHHLGDTSFSGKFEEIPAKVLRIRKNLLAATPMFISVVNFLDFLTFASSLQHSPCTHLHADFRNEVAYCCVKSISCASPFRRSNYFSNVVWISHQCVPL